VSPIRSARPALVHDWLTGMRGGEKVLEAIASRSTPYIASLKKITPA
jgi:hypothetical protein